MKRVHATFMHVMTHVRIVMLFVFSMLFVAVIPFFGTEESGFLLDVLNYVGFLYVILTGFLMSIAIKRRNSLGEHINQELSKIRRMYHLALHMAKEQPKLETWFKSFKEDLDAYLSLFREASFYVYERGNDLFRNVTYTLYTLPSLGIPYNRDLYEALLNATSLATEARQNIRSKKDQYIGYFQWMVIIIVTITFAWILASATPPDGKLRLVSALVIFNVLLALDLLYEYDRYNDKKLRLLADQYAGNLSHVAELKETKKRSR
jgi:hypothetical protein